jgi:hypothetical protein
LFVTAIMGGTVTRLKATNLTMAHGGAGWSGASGKGSRVRKLFPSPVAWRQVLEVGPGARPIADGPGNDFLPGALEAVESPATVFVDPACGDYRTNGPYVGRGADLEAIHNAIPQRK